MHYTLKVVGSVEHRNMSLELLEVRPSLSLNVFPIYFDEVVTFTEREQRSAVKLERRSFFVCLRKKKEGGAKSLSFAVDGEKI